MPTLDFPSVWQFAPGAVDMWDRLGEATTVLQAIILAGIVGLAVWMFVRFFKRLTAEVDTAE